MEACGETCKTPTDTAPNAFKGYHARKGLTFPLLRKRYDCASLYANSALEGLTNKDSSPCEIPAELFRDFSMDGQIFVNTTSRYGCQLQRVVGRDAAFFEWKEDEWKLRDLLLKHVHDNSHEIFAEIIRHGPALKGGHCVVL